MDFFIMLFPAISLQSELIYLTFPPVSIFQISPGCKIPLSPHSTWVSRAGAGSVQDAATPRAHHKANQTRPKRASHEAPCKPNQK